MRRNGAFARPYIFGAPGGSKFTSIEHSCEMPSMNDDVPALDAEGLTSFYAEKTAQSLYAQLGLRQTLLSELIHGLKQPDVQTEALFTDRCWLLVRSFAPRQSWLAVLERNGFPCSQGK